MRICMIHNEYGKPSGEEAVVEQACRLLEEHGHEVVRFTRTSAEIPRMRLGKVRAFLSGIHSFSSARAMRRFLNGRNRPDVVHVHNVYPLISPSVLAECRKAGVPVVMTVHNYRLVCPNGLHLSHGEVCEKCMGGREYWCLLRNCEGNLLKSLGYALRGFVARKRRTFLDNVTMYAALTEFAARRLAAEGFPADRIAVVPNMVSVSSEVGRPSSSGASPHHARCDPTSGASPHHARCDPTAGDCVAYVGRVSPEKGVPVLLEAARRCPEIPFRAAGAYHRMPELPSQAPGNFRFLGHLAPVEMPSFYASSRIVVLCSTCFEGFPAAIAEAMLYAKPVVCSRTGGLPEIVDDGETGLLFEPGNVDDLTEKIRHLWARPGLCQRMGRSGRRKAAREYSPDAYYERLTAVYDRALALGSGGRPTGSTRRSIPRSERSPAGRAQQSRRNSW